MTDEERMQHEMLSILERIATALEKMGPEKSYEFAMEKMPEILNEVVNHVEKFKSERAKKRTKVRRHAPRTFAMRRREKN